MSLLPQNQPCPICGRELWGDYASHIKRHAVERREEYEMVYSSPERKASAIEQITQRAEARSAVAGSLLGDRAEIAAFLAHITSNPAEQARLTALIEEHLPR
jgi:hypothetical protein